MRTLAVILAATAAVTPAAFARSTPPPSPSPSPSPSAPSPPTGTLAVCNVQGARPISGSFSYTFAAPASAGGTQTLNVAVGACSAQIFYPQGTSVTVTENVPTGYAVTAIGIAGGGSTIGSSAPAAGSAVVVIGSGQSLLTFTTSGPATPSGSTPPPDCKVPNVIGLGLTTAKAAVKKAGCAVGIVQKVYSSVFRAGRVVATAPRRGTILAPHAPVDIRLSRGPKP